MKDYEHIGINNVHLCCLHFPGTCILLNDAVEFDIVKLKDNINYFCSFKLIFDAYTKLYHLLEIEREQR